jgi:tRNA(fMet)-specific endonuclease VapC
MIVLDTDHVSVLKYSDHPRAKHLVDKLDARPMDEAICLTIVTVEEQMRGWLAAVAKERQSHRQVMAYRELQRLFEYFQLFQIIAFDESCADQFERLRAAKIRIGTMDLKIAATALVHDALLLSANLRDFERVPGLRVEDWLD